MTHRRRAILWDTPYGGMKLRGQQPARAYDAALALAAQLTDQDQFGAAELAIYVWPTAELATWAQSHPDGCTLSADRAAQQISAPPAPLLPTMTTYGAPFCEAHETEAGRVYLRLSWHCSWQDEDFSDRSTAWMKLASAHTEDPPFEDDLPVITAYFNLREDALLTAPNSAEVLPHQEEAGWPKGAEIGLQGFASVPDGGLLLNLGMPFESTNAAFVAFDRALVRTLGKFSENRYRLVTPGGARRKMSWRR